MRNFKTTVALLVAASCCATPDMAHAFQLVTEEADVRLVDGMPAICIPEKAKRSFPVAGLLLMEHDTLEPRSWAISLKEDAKPTKLKPGSCIPYNATPDGYEQDPPEQNWQHSQLKLNTTYYIQARRSIPNLWYFPTAIYEATFCLKEATDSAVSIQKGSACPDSSR